LFTRAQQLLRWATVWPQQTWAESGDGLLWGALGPHWVTIEHNVAWAEAYLFTKWQPFDHN